MWLFVYWKTEIEGKITYSVIKIDGLDFVRLYFLNYTQYVNNLHKIFKRTSKIFKFRR